MQFPQMRSVKEFVALEEGQEQKFEFAESVVSLFSSGTLRHEILVANLTSLLHSVVLAGKLRTSGLKALTDTSSRFDTIYAGTEL